VRALPNPLRIYDLSGRAEPRAMGMCVVAALTKRDHGSVHTEHAYRLPFLALMQVRDAARRLHVHETRWTRNVRGAKQCASRGADSAA
jgi:hypothetical protein